MPFAGLFEDFRDGYRPFSNLRGGMITGRIQPSGAMSGVLRLGPRSISLVGVLQPDPPPTSPGTVDPDVNGSAARSKLFHLPSIFGSRLAQLMVRQWKDADGKPAAVIYLTIIHDVAESIAEYHGGGVIDNVRPVMDANSPNAKMMPGRYTLLLESPSLGSGFASIVIDKSLQAIGVGTLPDGRSLTFSSPLVESAGGLPGPMIFCSKKMGHLTIGQLTADFSVSSPPSTVAYSGVVQWSRRLWPESTDHDGIDDRALEISGVAYVPPSGSMPLLANLRQGPLNTEIALGGGSLRWRDWRTAFTFTPTHAAVFPSPNPNKLRLDIFKPTGFFTGTFLLDDFLRRSSDPGARRIVQFRGMLAPGLSRGQGFFLLNPDWNSGNVRISVPED